MSYDQITENLGLTGAEQWIRRNVTVQRIQKVEYCINVHSVKTIYKSRRSCFLHCAELTMYDPQLTRHALGQGPNVEVTCFSETFVCAHMPTRRYNTEQQHRYLNEAHQCQCHVNGRCGGEMWSAVRQLAVTDLPFQPPVLQSGVHDASRRHAKITPSARPTMKPRHLCVASPASCELHELTA
jgi:hypothetical protein